MSDSALGSPRLGRRQDIVNGDKKWMQSVASHYWGPITGGGIQSNKAWHRRKYLFWRVFLSSFHWYKMKSDNIKSDSERNVVILICDIITNSDSPSEDDDEELVPVWYLLGVVYHGAPVPLHGLQVVIIIVVILPGLLRVTLLAVLVSVLGLVTLVIFVFSRVFSGAPTAHHQRQQPQRVVKIHLKWR